MACTRRGKPLPIVADWGPYYIRRVQAMLDDQWTSGDVWGGLNSGMVQMAPYTNVPAEVKEALRAKLGLDDPVWQRYFRWLWAMLHGDWGFSFISRVDVDTLILQRVPVTLAVLRPGLPKDLLTQVQKVLLATVTMGTLDGFRAVSPELYRTLRAEIRPPDLMIYLRCPLRTLTRQLDRRDTVSIVTYDMEKLAARPEIDASMSLIRTPPAFNAAARGHCR